MSSEPEENADHVYESNAEPSANEGDGPSCSKDNALNESVKPKKRRRGKKRKHRKESAATCESENLEEHAESEHENHDSPPWDSDEDLSCDVSSFTDVIIRPINVPKAPENSTQFIMDDHQECRLYMSFETPNPYLSDAPPIVLGDIVEPVGEDAAYRDIDFEYESPQDFDNSAYYDREFEQSYKSNRFDELMRLPRAELIGMLHSLESRSKELKDDLVKENPSPMLDKLQHELLELQEKHNVLQEHNSELIALVNQHENSDVIGESSRNPGAEFAEPRCSVSPGSYSPLHEIYYPSFRSMVSKMREGSESPDSGSSRNEAGPYRESPISPDPETFPNEARPFGGRWASPDSSSFRNEAGPYRESPGSPDSSSFRNETGGKSESPDPGPSGARPGSGSSRDKTGLFGGRSESVLFGGRSESCRDEAGPFGGRSESPESEHFASDLNSHGVSYNNDERSEPRAYSRSPRQTNNVDGVILNVAFQEKCSSVVIRDEELPASETSVI